MEVNNFTFQSVSLCKKRKSLLNNCNLRENTVNLGTLFVFCQLHCYIKEYLLVAFRLF